MQDITTKWNSTFYMAERLLEQKRASLPEPDTLTNLTIQQWGLMDHLLKPFEEIMKINLLHIRNDSTKLPNCYPFRPNVQVRLFRNS